MLSNRPGVRTGIVVDSSTRFLGDIMGCGVVTFFKSVFRVSWDHRTILLACFSIAFLWLIMKHSRVSVDSSPLLCVESIFSFLVLNLTTLWFGATSCVEACSSIAVSYRACYSLGGFELTKLKSGISSFNVLCSTLCSSIGVPLSVSGIAWFASTIESSLSSNGVLTSNIYLELILGSAIEQTRNSCSAKLCFSIFTKSELRSLWFADSFSIGNE